MDGLGLRCFRVFFGRGTGVRAPRWARGVVALAVVLPAGVVGPSAVAHARPGTAAAVGSAATVTVQMSGDPVAAGSPLRATASVVAASGTDVPSGAVQFTVDGAAVGSPVDLVGGQGSAPLALAVGAHAVSARYAGDSTFAAGDAGPGISEVVVPPGTTSFVPVQPARILDTRPGSAQTGYSGDKPAAGATVPLQVAGRGGVPSSGASAVVLNVTATAAAGPGYVTVWPADRPRPLASNLNLEFTGETIPNLVVVPLSAAGVADLYTSASAHLVADVAGYFVDALSATDGRFVPVDPGRLLDTRDGTGYSGGRPQAGTTVTLKVAGRAGVPAEGAGGVVLNVTATRTDAAPGYVTVWPSDRPRPLASNLNTTAGNQTIPNAVWVPLSASGTVSLYVSTGTDLVADVAGWFTGRAAPDSTAGLFVATQPSRILDTRPGTGQVGYTGAKPAAQSTVALKVAGAGPVPAAGVAAAVLNVTTTQSDGPGYVTAYPAGTTRPTASNLNLERRDQTRPNLVTTPLGSDSVNLYTSVGTHLVADVAGWFTPDLDPPKPVTQHETFQAAGSTTVLNPGDVTAVTGDPTAGYTVTLGAGVRPPATGAGVVLKGGGSAYPDGLAGTVSAVDSGGTTGGTTTVRVSPTPPDRLLDKLDIGYDGPANLALETGGGANGAARRDLAPADVVGGTVGIDHSVIDFGAGAFECDVAGGVSVSASVVRFENTHVHFEKRAGLLTAPFVNFYVQTEPVVQFTGDIHGKVTCRLSDLFRATHRLVWVLPTEIPVTVDLAPALQFEATIAGKASFTEHFYRMVGLSTNPDLSLHIYNGASQTTESADLSAEVSASLLIGADVSVKVLDIAGIGVTLGPQFVASVNSSRCTQLTVGIHADFDVRINLWIKQFKQTLLGFDIGPWTLYYHCPGGGGSGGSPLGVLTTDLPSAVVGQAYTASLQAAGGAAPYTWQVTGLPPGLASDAAGHIGGTPTTSNWTTLTVTVTDSAGATATGHPPLSVGSSSPGTTLVSAGPDGRPGNGRSGGPLVSTDGAYVYYASTSTNLTADALPTTSSVYVYDVAAKSTTRLFPPDGSTDTSLLTLSANGRYALVGDPYGSRPSYRYDRVTGAYTPVHFTYYGGGSGFQIADDGDLVYLGAGTLTRLSGGSGVAFRCPDGTALPHVPGSVHFTHDGSAVYFDTDGCGYAQYGAYRLDLATGTSRLLMAGDCYFNGGNECVDQIQPNSSGTHQAIRRLAPGNGGNSTWTLLVDNYTVGRTTIPAMYLCGVAEDGRQVVFSAGSDLVAGGTQGGQEVFAIDVATATITRISPASGPTGLPWAGCTVNGYASGANVATYVYNQQVYLRQTR